jgi:hypothetical protein
MFVIFLIYTLIIIKAKSFSKKKKGALTKMPPETHT